MVKRNVIENIVPIVVALKRKLAASKSPLMGNLMKFLRELMKDYKNEIQEILAEDRQLMAEIDFDLKRFEQQEKADANRQSVAPRIDSSMAPPPATPLPEAANLRQDEPQRRRETRASSNNTRIMNQPKPVGSDPKASIESDEELPQPETVTPEEPAIAPEVMEQDDDEEEAMDTSEPPPTPDKNLKNPMVPTAEPAASKTTPEPLAGPSGHQAQEETPTKTKAKTPKKKAAQKETKTAFPPPAIPVNTRLRQRVVSTPIRPNATLAELTFSASDADISVIPYAEPEVPQNTKNTRRRRL